MGKIDLLLPKNKNVLNFLVHNYVGMWHYFYRGEMAKDPVKK